LLGAIQGDDANFIGLNAGGDELITHGVTPNSVNKDAMVQFLA
jgi:hypothetical protein